MTTLLGEVSIRSPHRSEGRLMKVRSTAAWTFWFQSAPPTGVRGDGLYLAKYLTEDKFQSAPPTGVRGDSRA